MVYFALKNLKFGVWIRILRVYNQITKIFGRELEAINLSPSQFYTLVTLSYTKEIPFRVLGEKLGVTVGNLTGLVDRLETKGFLERVRGKEDRRVIYLRLTPSGKEAVKKGIEIYEKVLTSSFAISDEEGKELTRILKKIETGVRALEAKETQDRKREKDPKRISSSRIY